MTTKFTPGPWFFDDEHEEVTAEARRRKGLTRIATVNLGWSEPFNSEQNANARLIAAAPDLLRYLKEARRTLEMWKDVAPAVSLCADIDAAIARATGEQP